LPLLLALGAFDRLDAADPDHSAFFTAVELSHRRWWNR
jgi:hypothetical protein